MEMLFLFLCMPCVSQLRKDGTLSFSDEELLAPASPPLHFRFHPVYM